MKHAPSAMLALMLLAAPALAEEPPAGAPAVPGWSSTPGHCSRAWREGTDTDTGIATLHLK